MSAKLAYSNIASTPLFTQDLDDGRQAKLTEVFQINLPGGKKVYVRTGFITDFASIPRFFWRILPPWDRHKRAALIHDWFYRGGYIVCEDGNTYRPSRKESDEIFRRLMEDLNVKRWKIRSMYVAVRAFGGWSYVTDPGKFKIDPAPEDIPRKKAKFLPLQ